MPTQVFSPAGMVSNDAYRHVAVATGTRQVQVAGQVARGTGDTAVAPGDLAGQVAQALRRRRR